MAAESKGLIAELFARRVPQIVGVYVGACWVLVEMGEWISDQMGASPNLVAYLFVLMIALLPSVGVLAWNHGAPGRDRWPRYEKLFVPANLVAAIVAVIAFFGYAPPGNPGSAIAPAESAFVERTLVDEAGESQTFRVARSGRHRLVASFFWRNASQAPDAAPDWRQFAVPWLLETALDPDPLLSVMTPFSGGFTSDLESAGLQEGIGESQALALQIARSRNADYLVRGTLEPTAEGWRLYGQVLNTASGATLTEEFAEGPSLVVAVERLSDLLRPHLTSMDTIGDRFVQVPLEEAVTPVEQALETAVTGIREMTFEGRPEQYVEAMRRALEIDPTFALAAVELSFALRSMGDYPAAQAATEHALRLEYKLSTRHRFAMKVNRYALTGDYETAMRVLRMWTEIHPENLRAWMSLARNQILLGQLDEAKSSLESAQQLSPANAYIESQRARVDQLQGNYEAAAQRLRTYIEAHPEDSSTRIELGQLLARIGEPAEAQEVLQDAALVANDSLDARLALADLHLRHGDFAALDEIISALLVTEGNADRRTRVLLLDARSKLARGRARAVLESLAQNEETLRVGMKAQDFWMRWGELQVQALLAIGDAEGALAAVERTERALGEPMDRFMTVEHVQVLTALDAPLDRFEAQLERIRLFETQFAFGVADALIAWTEALVLAATGEHDEAAGSMMSARSHYLRSGLGLDLRTIDMMDLDRARHLKNAGRTGESLDLLTRLVEEHPAFANARLVRATLRAASGETEAARTDLVHVLDQWSEADESFVPLKQAKALFASL